MLAVTLHQYVRIRREHRTQNQCDATGKRLPAGHSELIGKNNAHAAHAQNNSANLCPAQTLSGQMKVRENQSERWECRLQKRGESGRDVLLAPEHQTVIKAKRKNPGGGE